jgi:hypothetical protein
MQQLRRGSLFSDHGSSAFGEGEAAVDFVPVDDVPPGGQIVGAAVLVLEIVGVLPDIVAEDGVEALGERRFLVGGGQNLELAAGEDQPAPARAELLGRGLVEGLLEASKSPKSAEIWLAMAPEGAPPMPVEPTGPIRLQNAVWLE